MPPRRLKIKSRFKNEKGYAYVMVLVAVVVLAILAETTYELMSYQVKHDREMELLFRGMAYQQAIGDYYSTSQPGMTPSFPRQLEDLISDPRFSHKKHLRALYPDPMGAGWSLVQAPDGGIAGVASKSEDKPLKQDNFPTSVQNFTGSAHYSDWVFLFQPGGTSNSGKATPVPSSSPGQPVFFQSVINAP
ncbi:MAG TPA: hypothetical protein VN963_04320, partial [bacterium]|nr:hypothetical protein [bacterium]